MSWWLTCHVPRRRHHVLNAAKLSRECLVAPTACAGGKYHCYLSLCSSAVETPGLASPRCRNCFVSKHPRLKIILLRYCCFVSIFFSIAILYRLIFFSIALLFCLHIFQDCNTASSPFFSGLQYCCIVSFFLQHVQSRRETMTVTAADTGPPGFNRRPRRAVFGKQGGISGIQET